MKRLLCILLFPLSSMAIELILDGKTYDIKEYKIENNGQRIIINHGNLAIANQQQDCNRINSNYKARSFKPVQVKPGPFQRLLDELDSGSSNQNDKKRKQRFQ